MKGETMKTIEVNGLVFSKYKKASPVGLQVQKLKSGLKFYSEGVLFAFIKYDITPFVVTATNVEHNGKNKTRYMFAISNKGAEMLNIPLGEYLKENDIVKSYVTELENLF